MLNVSSAGVKERLESVELKLIWWSIGMRTSIFILQIGMKVEDFTKV